MRHPSKAAHTVVLATLFVAGAALAQSGNNTNTPSGTPPAGTPPASVPASDQANPQAVTATSTADANLAKVRERAQATSEKDKKSVEAKLDATKTTVDKEAAAKGDNVVAGRLATEFGMTADALTAEKAKYNTGWGDLMIAHSLLANDKTGLTLDQLFQMRTDGMGWGQIANGMGMHLGEVVSAVKSEGKVATGQAKGDGKVAAIHSGAGGESETHASSHSHAGSGTGAASKGMGAGAGAGAGASGTHGHSGK